MSLTKVTTSMIDTAAVNIYYPDDYWNGTEDYGLAINRAIALARPLKCGEIRFTRSALITTPINATGLQNIIFKGYGGVLTGGATVLTGSCSGAFFDCTGSDNLTFYDVTIAGDINNPPDCGILLARGTGGNGSGHKFYNLQSPYYTYFKVAVVYSYASEVCCYFGCSISNAYANASTIVFTANNNITATGINPQTSIYTTIETGTWSNTGIFMYGCTLVQQGGGVNRCFYFDQVSDINIIGGFTICSGAPGLATFWVFTGNGGCSNVLITGMREEPTAHLYSVFFSLNATQTFHNWTHTNCRTSNTSNLYATQNVGTFINLTLQNLFGSPQIFELPIVNGANISIFNATVTCAGLISDSIINADSITASAGTNRSVLTEFATGRATTNYGIIHNRNATTTDFTVSNFTTDGTYRTLDLSSIVPARAIFVLLRVTLQDDAAGNSITFRSGIGSPNESTSVITTQVANIPISADILVDFQDSSVRTIAYLATSTTFTTINVVVKGWSS